MIEEAKHLFPQLRDETLWNDLISHARTHRADKGNVLIRPGQFVNILPLVLEGSVKVFREDQEGGELLLYTIQPGESCALSLTATLSERPSEIKAVAESTTHFVAVPAVKVREWLRKHNSWQMFTMQLYHDRFEELLYSIDAIAFKQLDERLLDYLEKQTLNTDVLKTTHQQIAYELGTSREVISRLLKQLEKKGMVALARNEIRVRSFMK